MWAAAIERNGGPEVLEYVRLADPVCAHDGLVLEVEAIGIEGDDLVARALAAPRQPWHVIGMVAAGTVVEIGASVTGWRLGQRVVTLGADGSHAGRRAVAAALSWPVPDGLAPRDAACVPVAFGTAFECLFTAGDLRAGQTVLIHAGAGGIGMAAIQLAKLAGATVIATASSAAKLDRLREFGLDHGIDYVAKDLVAEAGRIAGPGGVDVVVDSTGGRTLAESTGLLAWRGRVVIAGAAAPGGSAWEAAALCARSNSLHGVRLSAVLDAEHGRGHAMVAECLARVAHGELKVQIAQVFPLAEAAAAHAFIEDGQAFGRVVMVPR